MIEHTQITDQHLSQVSLQVVGSGPNAVLWLTLCRFTDGTRDACEMTLPSITPSDLRAIAIELEARQAAEGPITCAIGGGPVLPPIFGAHPLFQEISA